MYSIQMIERIFKSMVGIHNQSKFNIELYGWNRTKDDKSDPEMVKTTGLTKVDAYGRTAMVSSTNQYIASFKSDVPNWDYQCYRAKLDCQKQEVGIGMLVQRPKTLAKYYNHAYLAMIDFNPGLNSQNRHVLSFWKDMEKTFPGRRVYLFDSGNAHHGMMDTLFDTNSHRDWMDFLRRHQEVVDQKWVQFASHHDHGGVIRMTAGTRRPQPRLWKWVNL